MSHQTIERFTFTKQPTGEDLHELIKDNYLKQHRVSIERVLNEPYNGMISSMSPYRWEVTFTKEAE